MRGSAEQLLETTTVVEKADAYSKGLHIYTKLHRKELEMDLHEFLLVFLAEYPIEFMNVFRKADSSIKSQTIKQYQETHNKIKTIALYKKLTGYDLKTSKDAVERILMSAGYEEVIRSKL